LRGRFWAPPLSVQPVAQWRRKGPFRSRSSSLLDKKGGRTSRLHQVCHAARLLFALSRSLSFFPSILLHAEQGCRSRPETSRMASRQTPLYTLCVTEFHRKRKEFQPISTTGINEISPACLDDAVKIMSHFKEDHHFA
jgi:hypothetical protein